MLRRFENRIDPYPAAEPQVPPSGFFAFVWHCTQGMRRAIAWLAGVSMLRSVFEALLFAMLGLVVDWLAQSGPGQLWEARRWHLMEIGRAHV